MTRIIKYLLTTHCSQNVDKRKTFKFKNSSVQLNIYRQQFNGTPRSMYKTPLEVLLHVRLPIQADVWWQADLPFMASQLIIKGITVTELIMCRNQTAIFRSRIFLHRPTNKHEIYISIKKRHFILIIYCERSLRQS
jgi:hypothetical protein